jgi:hypothetical protein
MHAAKCKICKHKDCKEINDRYLAGVSPYEIDYPGISHQCVYKHVKTMGLEEQRDNSTLAIVNMLIDRGNAAKIQITPGVFMDSLKLRAKLLGEIIDKKEVKDVTDDETKPTGELQREIVELIAGEDEESQVKTG